MTDPTETFTRDQAKRRARDLRTALAAAGETISQSEALERVAHSLGFRDWNTASARLSNQPDAPLQVGDAVSGRYLKQAFTGRVLAVRVLGGGSAFHVTLDFDAPVDVVEWESFSALRKRVGAQISADGRSFSKTSDGAHHLVVERRSAAIV